MQTMLWDLPSGGLLALMVQLPAIFHVPGQKPDLSVFEWSLAVHRESRGETREFATIPFSRDDLERWAAQLSEIFDGRSKTISLEATALESNETITGGVRLESLGAGAYAGFVYGEEGGAEFELTAVSLVTLRAAVREVLAFEALQTTERREGIEQLVRTAMSGVARTRESEWEWSVIERIRLHGMKEAG
jgi:hypothetical protein